MMYRQTLSPRGNVHVEPQRGIFDRRWLSSKTNCLNRFNRAVVLPVTVPGVTPVAAEFKQHAKVRKRFEKYTDVVLPNSTTCDRSVCGAEAVERTARQLARSLKTVVVLSVAIARARFLVYCCFEPARLPWLMHITWRDLIITAWMHVTVQLGDVVHP